MIKRSLPFMIILIIFSCDEPDICPEGWIRDECRDCRECETEECGFNENFNECECCPDDVDWEGCMAECEGLTGCWNPIALNYDPSAQFECSDCCNSE